MKWIPLNKFANLLQKVENFYNQAINYYFDKTAADEDDNELYFELRAAASQLKDPDAIDELLIIAELYQAAIKMGQGFSSVNTAIKNFMREYPDVLGDEDSDENELENILDEIISDLRNRAGGAAALKIEDSLEIKKRLQEVKLQKELEQDAEAASEGPSAFEIGLGVAPEESEGGYQKPSDESARWNPFMEGGGKDADKTNVGYSAQRIYEPKDWVKTFLNEAERYQENLEGETNSKVIDKTKELIDILKRLSILAGKREELRKKLSIAQDANDQKQFEDIEKQISDLSTTRRKIKSTLRRYFSTVDQNKLQSELDRSTGSEKFLLEQKIAIKEALASRDRNRHKEITLRRDLVNMIEGKARSKVHKGWVGGGMPTGETLAKILREIEAAKAERIPIGTIRVEEANRLREIKKAGTLEGQIVQLRQDIASRKKDLPIQAKGLVKKDAGLAAYKTQIQNAQKTYQQNPTPENKKILDEIEISYARAVENFINNYPPYIQFLTDRVELLAYRDELAEFNKKNWFDEQGSVTEQISAEIVSLLNKGLYLLHKHANVSVFSAVKRERSPNPGSIYSIIKILQQIKGN